MPVDPTAQTQAQERRQAWQQISSSQFDTPDDLYQTKGPAVTFGNQDYQKKVGIGSALIKGLPSDRIGEPEFNPDYEPTFGEAIAAGTTDFIRSGVDVATEFFSEDRKNARASVDRLREYDPELADVTEERMIGKKLSNKQLAIKGGAALAEGVLTVLPFFKAGRVALGAAEAATAAKLPGATNSILRRLYQGGASGALYGGLYGLHKYDADWEKAVKSAAMGGAFGGGLLGLGSSLASVAKMTGTKITSLAKSGLGALDDKLAETLPAKWYSGVFSVDKTLKKYYGEIGENFSNMFKNASREGTRDLGKVQLSMVENGLMKPPLGTSRFFPGVEYVGDNAELMAHYNRVLRGQGPYKNAVARATAINADKRLTYLDQLRKTYAARAESSGVVKELLDPDTYLPKHTPTQSLSSSAKSALAKTTDRAEREAIYAKNDPLVKEMVENSVLNEKVFDSLEESYATYYDYADLVEGGSRSPMNDNKMLQRMVRKGQASSIEEARGKILADLKFRKKTLTPTAGSLDFKREVDLPWYDPNPSRVMPQYAFDASMRIEMAKTFGAKDEVLNKMIGSIKADLDRGINADDAAKEFEKLVRHVTGQVERGRGEEKISSAIRAIQVPKLAFAQIINLGQSLNTLLGSDLGSTMHGLKAAFTNKGSRKAIENGVLTSNFIRQIFEYSTGGSQVAENILKYSGFTYTEMFNRTVASSAADFWVTKNLEKAVKSGGKNQAAIWALRELNLPVDEIIKRGKILPEEMALAAQTFVEKTQFLGHPIDLPYFASTPIGKVLFQFKTFAYQQAKFVSKEMKNQFARGNYSRAFRNLFILGTVFPMTGEVLADVRSLVTQEKRPTKFLDRYIADIFSAGTFGLFTDFYTSAQKGKTSDLLLGPTAGDAIRYLEALVQATTDPGSGLKSFTKQALRQTGVGRVGVNVMFPPNVPGKTSIQSLMDWAGD